MKPTSGCASFHIPAKVFKECKQTLSIPLTLFWQKSFTSGHIPKEYKTQHIIPKHKKGDKTLAKNHRPIVLTPHEVKIFERVIKEKLTTYLETNSLLNNNQHGFRKHHSCSTQLVSFVNNILSNLAQDNDTDSIYIDYSKAFDKIDHNLLIHKLTLYNITGNYLNWITSFLKHRSQTVCINNTFSYPTSVDSGVPQGSVLGPLLFILFINDLPNTITNSTLLTFADDTKIVSKIANATDTSTLQQNLDKIINWSKVNNMELNKDKFEFISHKINTDNNNLKLLKVLPLYNEYSIYNTSNQHSISPSDYVKDLGITIDNKLNWNQHIFTISRKAKQITGWILSVFYSRDKNTMLTLFNSLVRSKLEYCCEIWSPHLIKNINTIEKIQSSFTYRIEGMKELNYWDRLSTLNIMSLQRRRERQTLLHVWKILNKVYPNTINLNFKNHQRSGAIRAIMKPLPKLQGRALTVYEESFLIKAAKLWNILPLNYQRSQF